MPKRKKCKICGKSLSIYNHTGQCFYHSENPKNWPHKSKIFFGGVCGNKTRNVQLTEKGYNNA